MGAYLSQPKTDKVSTDELSDRLTIGASSMQGWRNSQEDAHNAIVDFDANTSFFAVYDGHGGAEVATYCADRLPEFLKKLELYKNGKLEDALRQTFLEFDRTLLEPGVIEVLKILAGDRNVDDSDNMEYEEDEEDLVELHEESHLPLNELLEKYKGHPSMPILSKIRNESAGSSSGQKPQSPYLRGRRTAAILAQATNKALMDPDSKPQGSSTSAAALAALNCDASPSSSGTSKSAEQRAEPVEDSTVSSSSSGSNAAKNHNNISNSNSNTEAEAATTNGAAKSAEATATLKPDSSHVGSESGQNGSVTSSEAKSIISSTATSSKSAAEDATVSGSNDDATVAAAAAAAKHNGSVDSSTAEVVQKSPPAKAEAGGAISSTTSKEAGKQSVLSTLSGSPCEEDEEDAEYQVNKSNEYSSEEEVDDDDDDDDEEDVDGDVDADNDDDDENGSDADTEEFDEEGDEDDDETVYANQQFCANMIEEPGKDSGCTAVVALLHGRDLYVANAGDSRCVVCRNGKAIEMSLDHKPEDEEESERIIKAGGRVTMDGRVNGGLNLSRAIGDHAYKMNNELPLEEQMISARPDIKKLIITPEDEFMVLACDGIWNFMSSDEVVEFVRKRLTDEKKKVSEICEELFDHCLAPDTMGDGTGCDNMTAVIVRFKPKILELPTLIDPTETEDSLKKQVTNKANDQHLAATYSSYRAQKRLASPNSDADNATDDNTNEAENANKTKRLKTDNDEKSNAVDASVDESDSMEVENAAKSVDSTTTMRVADDEQTANAEAEKNECDSVVSTATIAAPITPAVSTT